MTDFSNRVESIESSGIREVFDAAGGDAINLGLGQPDFPTPENARNAAVEAIQNGNADGYTSNRGIESLREAISDKHARDNGFDVAPENLIATAGGSEALHLAMETHVDSGEEVIVPDPGFVAYPALTHLAGGVPNPIGLREDLTMDPAALEAAITENTAAFVICSPANPTGAVQSEDDMREFARIADEHDILCISDEVYERIVFEGEHHSPMKFAETDNVVVVNACSKTYSMTGWRLGWIAASDRRIDRMLKAHQYVQACASAPAQYAAAAALSGPQNRVHEMVSAFEERRNVLLDGLADAGLKTPTPDGAFYAMPAVPDGWIDECLDRDVIVVPGEAFGERGAGHARISYAAGIEDLKDAIEAMDAAARAIGVP